MYRVLLVDDETLNYQLIEKLVDWKEKGFEIAGYASDGMEAIQKYEEISPDLIFMDIQLPIMDGLECIRCIREADREVKIVIISAYGDFSYAQKAIRYGVQDFLLKPVSRLMLNQLVDKMRTELDERNAHTVPETVLDNEEALMLKSFRVTADPGISLKLKRQPVYGAIFLNEEGLRIEKFRIEQRILELEEDLRAAFIPEDGRAILLIKEGRLRKAESLLAEEEGLVQLYPLVSGQSPEAWMERLLSGENPGFYEESGCLDSAVCDFSEGITNFGNLEDCLLEAIVSGKGQAFSNHAEQVLEEARVCRRQPQEVKNAVIDMLVSVKVALKRYDFCDSFGLMRNVRVDQIQNCESYGVLLRIVRGKLSELFENIEQIRQNQRLVFNTNVFTEKYYRDPDFSVQKAADYNNLSKNYFMKLYKEQAGMGYWEYVTGLRMEKARDLLLATDELAGSIGRMVGYESEFHFSRKFKEYFGTSPNAYRKNR